MRHLMLAMALMALAGRSTSAGEFNKKLSVGDAAPDWKELTGTDGKMHALADFAEKPVLVLAFTCNGCPIAEGYEDRLIALAKAHAADVAVVAINPNPGRGEALPAMTERAKKKKFPFAYLADPTQATAKAYGATYTPEFVVLNKARKVVYLGAFDDKDNAADAKEGFVEAAVTATLAGKPAAKGETLGRGCLVKYKRD